MAGTAMREERVKHQSHARKVVAVGQRSWCCQWAISCRGFEGAVAPEWMPVAAPLLMAVGGLGLADYAGDCGLAGRLGQAEQRTRRHANVGRSQGPHQTGLGSPIVA